MMLNATRPHLRHTGPTLPVQAARILIWVCGRLTQRSSFEDYLLHLCTALARAGVGAAVRAGAECHPGLARDLAAVGAPVVALPDAQVESLGRFARELRATGADLVHCHFGSPSTPFAAIARLLGARRFVFSDHGSRQVLEGPGGVAHRLKRLRRRALAAPVDLYLPVSGFVARQLTRELGGSGHPVHTLMNGVDLSRFAPPPAGFDRDGARAHQLGLPAGSQCLMFVGQLIEQKGVADLLAVQADLLARFPALHVVWVGDGPLRPRVAATAGPRVHVLGRQTDVPDLLRLADLVVAPSRWAEAFALVLAEAAACGVPVVATAVGGIPEVVDHGVTGLLVPPGDSSALRRATTILLGDPALRARLGPAARARACRMFSVETTVEMTLHHYRRLLCAPHRSGIAA